MDECIIQYVELRGDKKTAQQLRDKFVNEVDEATEVLQQSGDFPTYALNNIKSFTLTASALFGGGQNLQTSQSMQAVFNGDSPDHYTESFKLLKKYIEQSLDQYKEDLQSNNFIDQARDFFNEEKFMFIATERENLNILEQVDSIAKLANAEVQNFINNKFMVKMSVYASQLLMHFVKLNQFILIMHILNQNITFQLSGEKNIVDMKGLQSYLISDNIQEINKTELVLGKLPQFSPEYAFQNQQVAALGQENPIQQNLGQGQTGIAQDVLQQKVQIILNLILFLNQKMKRQAQNILTETQIPMPRIEDELQQKIFFELNQQVKLGDKSLPSIACISLQQTYRLLTAVTLSQSSNLLVCGFQDSSIKVFILDQGKNDAVSIYDVKQEQYERMKAMQNGGQQISQQNLQQKKKVANPGSQTISLKESKQDIEERKSQSEFVLLGHSGPVYGLSVLIDDKTLLSSSFDTTIRLWSLQQKTLIGIFHGHNFPVWNVQFSPLGSYFASCSNDRTAKIWQIKQHVPIRIFVGHLSDVDAIEFHPNIHYLATGSSDKQIRLWSFLTGECVRIMLTVAGTIRSLKFTKAGNHLIAGNEYGELVIFDINKAIPLEIIQTCQSKAIWTIDVSWDDQIISIGTEDSTIELYSLSKILAQQGKIEQYQQTAKIPGKSSSTSFLKMYKTKANGILITQFTWKNFLYAVGQIILAQEDKIKIVSDLAFDAVDLDGSGFLEKDELAEVMKNVAYEMKVKPPTDGDIDAVLRELDEDYDEKVSKDEFVQLIIQVMKKMLESEEDLQKQINSQVKKQ
eukprot:403331938